MTIAVVSTFVKPPIQEMPVGSAAPPATEHLNSGLDFASMLLGQPVIAAKPLPDDDQPVNSELAIADAGTAAAATDPQFLATLGFPPAQQPGSAVLATNPEIDPSRSVRTEALLPSTPARIAPDTPEIRAQTSDERQPAASTASTALATDDKPAKFAVAEFAVPSAVPSAEPSGSNTPELRDPASGPNTLAASPASKQSGSNPPEPPFAPTSGPNTLAASPSSERSGANPSEPPFAPTSSPSTLAASPSSERSGANPPEPPFAPTSNPSTLATSPSSERSGANPPEPPFAPASRPSTLAASPSSERSGSNPPEPPFALASRPSTLAASPSSERSGSNPPEPPFALTSSPSTLAASPASERSGSNPPELPFDPASSLNTLASLPGNFVSGAAVTHDIPHHLQTPLHDPSWANDLGQKLLWFASNEKQLAQLTLHPPQLGSIEITLNLDKDGASAHFVSLNADVRGAIETAVPRLREMFAGTGIALGQVSVGSESFRQQSDGQQEPSHRPRPLADNAILNSNSINGLSGKTFVTQRGRGLIDIFA